MKTIFTIFFLLLTYQSFACSCVTMGVVERYGKADFVAKAKILDVKPDPEREEFHVLKVQIVDLFKGNKINTLYLNSDLKSSCAFLTPENTTWLIFANKNSNGELGFGLCSGPQQVDRVFDSSKYPNASKNHQKSLDLKFEVLEYLNSKNIDPKNEFNLPLFLYRSSLKDFKGIDLGKEKFALYEVTVKKNLSIQRIKEIKGFRNKKISKKILQRLKEDLEIGNTDRTEIPKKVKLILPLYYYPEDNGDPSFLSRHDL